MKVGLIGLGKMGLNLAKNMRDNGVDVVAFDVFQQARENAESSGIQTASDLTQLIAQLEPNRIIWVMVPAGKPTNDTIVQLRDQLSPEDIVIDGGNSFYQNSLTHDQMLKERKIHFFDVGTSGGMEGALHNGNFMIGGEKEIFGKIEPLFKAIAAKDGYLYTGKAGSGHYLKMVHNGIEYGMMQAIGEGFEVLAKSQFEYDNEAVAKVWNNGSVVRSWLMELAESAFSSDPKLDEIKGVMHSSGEGAWTVEEAIKLHVPTPVISSSLMMRYRSEEDDTVTGKVVAALRNGFGGHAVDHKD
ncbi:phosphogluconate dehydrogenase (NAD(+)-dependent, decarboxylating) [Pediococcus stilesii]|uniref:6-phosphogluconate dehydrogenase-like protein n=1 Tax=Pediococcus stilesii TaxID=331679 RepID=A0A0R2KY98_9LACO|nr:decarboxylating 6-phosphogluconate dehydrogenase [Pediococcus stilesii]KRN94256.1 6-phosphogluconate dehydrogenase-like protein [Pediococcus stilesii]